MCGRYSIFRITDREAIEERFGARVPEGIEPRYNAAPSQRLPVVTSDEPDVVSRFQWGLVPRWADDPAIGDRLINARAETLAEKNSFRDAYRHRRCLVLADGFYEWADTETGKQPYRVITGDEPFAMAGLWERWDPTTATGGGQTDLGSFAGNGDPSPEPLETYTIITTEPNETVGAIHDRMPVVLTPDEEDRWLAGDGSQDLLDPYDGKMRTYPVSKAVNDPSNDSPSLVTEIDAGA